MDFDDLDEAINARIAEEGGLSGAAAALAGTQRPKPGPYAAKGFMPLMMRNQQLPASAPSDVERKVCIRAFLFHGPGDTAAAWGAFASKAPVWMEMVVHEWPSHGARQAEAPAQTLEELAADAYNGVKDILEDHTSGGTFEGAPFALIGHSTGAQVIVLLANRLRFEMGLDPVATIVLDRAPLDVPLLSEQGVSLLNSNPEDFIKAFQPAVAAEAAAGGRGAQVLKQWLQDMKVCTQTKDDDFHKFSNEVLVVRSKGLQRQDELGRLSAKFQQVALQIEGSPEALKLPIQANTRAVDLRSAVARCLGAESKAISLHAQEGAGQRALADAETVGQTVIVKGVQSLRPAPHAWPHPVAIIGCGYNGLKTAMEYIKSGQENIVLFDRYDKVGGYCWITAANKHSKLQTEFGAFHLWWGPEYNTDPRGGWPEGWDCHAGKQKVLEHFHHGAERWGVLPHCCLQTNVAKLDVVGGKDKLDRYYKLTLESLKGEKTTVVKASVIYNYPGSMTRNRVVIYPGEEEFGAQIGYGMGDEFTYDERLKGTTTAILGNGAFAVENVRTCIEHAAEKVYLVTRRKNLASPRVPCWFVHQGPLPTPGRMVLEMFEPMYKLCGMGDPWQYWSVHASKDRQKVSIIQASRFGIGDVTFLAVAYGILEYVEDILERLTKHTLHLKSGRKLTGVNGGLIKSLGLLGDFEVDRLHNMKQMVGMWCDGDYRRVLSIDATGMNAANFTTFSLGIGVHANVQSYKFLHDYPREYQKLEEAGILHALPKSRADEKLDRPAYVVDVKYQMTAGIIIESMCPRMGLGYTQQGPYKYCLYHRVHPVDKFLEYCEADWEKYQAMFQERGHTREPVKYPYNKEMIKGFVDEYNRTLGLNTSVDGPSPEETQAMLRNVDTGRLTADAIWFRSALFGSLAKDLHVEPELFEGLQASHVARERLTASAPGSALDFDLERMEGWKNWTSASCTVEDVADSDPSSIKAHPKVMELVYGFLDKHRAKVPGV